MSVTVSCIIPVYNAERYLARCLESVLAQDYHELEIILIDDGSTDTSGIICDEYSSKFDNVHVVHIPNQGASLARKKGIEVAKGEYLTFVDSDDYIASNYVSTLYHLIKKYGTKISACGVKRICENENVIEGECKNEKDELLDFDELMPRFFKYEFWGFWGGLYHRSVFDGLIFPKATLSEDYYVKMQMFFQERKMVVTDAPLYFYEYHPASLSHTKLSERAFEEFENVKATFEYVKDQCPKYMDFALSNVIETSVKICLMRKNKSFNTDFTPIYTFLRTNHNAVRHLSMLNRNTRIIALGLGKYPILTTIICRLML